MAIAKQKLQEKLEEIEKNDQPRRPATSTALLESIQNQVTIQGSKAKPKAAKVRTKPKSKPKSKPKAKTAHKQKRARKEP
jgi:hypothetical protein